MTKSARGTLFLIVGPSGAGKDTLIDGVRAALAGDLRFTFARRVITRPAEAGGEAHEAATVAAFLAEERAGGFALSWAAHGLHYGIRPAALAGLAQGRDVVASVSRAVIERARQAYAPIKVIEITAAPDVLARRLALRGRESETEIAERLARAEAVAVTGPGTVRIDNSGTIAAGVEALRQVLLGSRERPDGPRLTKV